MKRKADIVTFHLKWKIDFSFGRKYILLMTGSLGAILPLLAVWQILAAGMLSDERIRLHFGAAHLQQI